MTADKTVLILKYVRIVEELARNEEISYEEALEIFYRSNTRRVIAEGIGDIHCMSVGYLADELVIECESRREEEEKRISRLAAYQHALASMYRDK